MQLFEQNLPEGFAWGINPNSQLGDILTDLEDSEIRAIMKRASDCGSVRDPLRAVDYNALADEFGCELFDGTDLEVYRNYLSTFVYTPYRTASDSDIQAVLDRAGFSAAKVVKNNKDQDLRDLVYQAPIMVAGGTTAVAGHSLAFAGWVGYELLVNGEIKSDNGSNLGYEIGSDSDYWGYVDLICGDVTYDENGLIDSVTTVQVSNEYEEQFKRLLLRTKPLHNWLILAVEFVDSNVIAQTGDPEIDTIAQTGDETIPIIAQTGV